jgi:hypothetical protein
VREPAVVEFPGCSQQVDVMVACVAPSRAMHRDIDSYSMPVGKLSREVARKLDSDLVREFVRQRNRIFASDP